MSAKTGELAITKGKVAVKRCGKSISEYAIGRVAGIGSRFLTDTEGGFIEIDNDNLIPLSGTSRVVLSSLGSGVVETYLPRSVSVDSFVKGTSKDVIGLSISQLPWKNKCAHDILVLTVAEVKG